MKRKQIVAIAHIPNEESKRSVGQVQVLNNDVAHILKVAEDKVAKTATAKAKAEAARKPEAKAKSQGKVGRKLTAEKKK